MQTKFIFVTGGVMSGLGKGVVTSSIAKLLQLSNQKVSCVKIDPYLNYDAGTMNPIAHGEVFVTEDGGECDMDIGNYERFLNQNIPKTHNITTAQIYSSVIEAERKGEYLGACVQIIPHVTDEIKRRIRKIAEDEKLDVLVVECGGTVGDIESLPFLEALRQMRLEAGSQNVIFVHVTLAPSLDVVGEQKTKPTQHSVQELRRIGIQPDLMAVRCSSPLQESTKKKISMFTNVTAQDVFSCHDVKSIFMVPQILYDQGIIDTIFRKFGKFGLVNTSENWDRWNAIIRSLDTTQGDVKIAMVGKYVTLADSYVSVNHALKHAGAKIGRSVSIDWIDSENINGNVDQLSKYNGILVPGGFGVRGAEGIISTANFAREKNIPYLGICFGFQLAAIAFGRYVCNYKNANSTELEPNTANPVVDLLPEQKTVSNMGGSLRLGAHEIHVKGNTLAAKTYNSDKVIRRHRHRYEINKKYIDVFEKNGLIFSAESDNAKRMEMLEIPSHKFYFGVQFHPEFNSRPGFPEESFEAFVRASAS
ncbi:glutamine hydrolyzing CTP synthase [Candidatus Nitrosotenuis cloacae]|uniref:glutamine hydrolyzing CTP synthase n=1 Tax=Candidatus Nitrosotenuis cloacae TaxID=1603555 RepID=UPI00227FE100|nr:CTP synthase (glutamine hydrolyzing) [Candidatus Nitrosotenuis cloacae]